MYTCLLLGQMRSFCLKFACRQNSRIFSTRKVFDPGLCTASIEERPIRDVDYPMRFVGWTCPSPAESVHSQVAEHHSYDIKPTWKAVAVNRITVLMPEYFITIRVEHDQQKERNFLSCNQTVDLLGFTSNANFKFWPATYFLHKSDFVFHLRIS